VNEVTLAFGAQRHLVGTLLVPDSTGNKPAIVFTNAGFVPRTGPNRLTVRLARLFGRHGFPSIRFDFSNVGDSGRAHGSEDAGARAISEIRQAMDIVQQQVGIQRFILFGLCSGTDPCIATAGLDPRVCGTLLLDPFSYPNTRARLLITWRKLKSHLTGGTAVRKLVQIVRRKMRLTRSVSAAAADDIWDDLRPKPPRETFAKSLIQALRGDRRILIIYTDFASETHNYRGQLKHVHPELRKSDGIEAVLLPDADHTYTHLFMQEQLTSTLLPWLSQNFGTGVAHANH
jgi:pimeloyl-ACP methyl ester carboxylesterase